MAPGIAALILLGLMLLAHYISIFLACSRYQRKPVPLQIDEPVSLVRPVCGIDQYDRGTLASSFHLDHPHYELIFCIARANDPAVALVKDLIAQHPHVPARLLIGDDRSSPNPKLNNIVKGWAAAQHRWIVLADSNVIMPPGYLNDLFAQWGQSTGLVCSPPVGCLPHNFWAEIECAFLNTYQARWQTAADSIGFGFAQGKSMLWRRDMLDSAGGIAALGREIAEDAAATKIVRKQGKSVRLVDRPFEQPLGLRTADQVVNRQVRWAKLRRATFSPYYFPEIFTGGLPPIAAASVSALTFGMDTYAVSALVLALWYLPEAELNRRAGWHFTWQTPLAWLTRDLLIPVVWLWGWLGNGFTWRGNEMSVRVPHANPHQTALEQACTSSQPTV